MNIKSTTALTLCVTALRYTYGRKSYLTGVVAEDIKSIFHQFTLQDQDTLERELVKLLDEKDPGMDIDKAVWLNLREFMR